VEWRWTVEWRWKEEWPVKERQAEELEKELLQ